MHKIWDAFSDQTHGNLVIVFKMVNNDFDHCKISVSQHGLEIDSSANYLCIMQVRLDPPNINKRFSERKVLIHQLIFNIVRICATFNVSVHAVPQALIYRTGRHLYHTKLNAHVSLMIGHKSAGTYLSHCELMSERLLVSCSAGKLSSQRVYPGDR